MFGKILSSTVNICAYEFRVYSFLYVIKYITVNDCFCHLCGVILTLKNNGCDNNDIEYGLFEDVINSYYLDSQIKDDFKCDQECYTDIQEKQQDQPLTPCTHAYDHITQHINNLEDPMQQNTLYTREEDASLFTSDTAAPCDYNITNSVPNSDTISENK